VHIFSNCCGDIVSVVFCSKDYSNTDNIVDFVFILLIGDVIIITISGSSGYSSLKICFIFRNTVNINVIIIISITIVIVIIDSITGT